MYSGLAEARQAIRQTTNYDQLKLQNALLIIQIMTTVGAKGHQQVLEILNEMD